MAEQTTTKIVPVTTETVTVSAKAKAPNPSDPAPAPAAPVRSSADILAEMAAMKATAISPSTVSVLESKVANLLDTAAMHGRFADHLLHILAKVSANPNDSVEIGTATGLPNLCRAIADLAVAKKGLMTAEIAALEQELGEAVEREDAEAAAAEPAKGKKGA